ncbi:hypothetical protein B0J11DRAFT_549613 [Dendryphion nanum]|uniref:DUF1989 domain-containing protein n=1 Tax=Dendryphion nanum TaxID=256645 RepID=A0A9P9DYE1_9PLEO|nr:hypothetical protein B0J11DRAFT_549613 [Dendryphion nanum]
MSGELQTIPARHGVATFVPRGRTIKIINTYGKQVVSTWAFGLHEPPEEDGDNTETQDEEAEVDEKTLQLKEEVEKEKEKEKGDNSDKVEQKKEEGTNQDKPKTEQIKEEQPSETGTREKEEAQSKREGESNQSEEAEDPPEQAPDTPEPEKTGEQTQGKKSEKRTWASYLPSIPYRNKGTPTAQGESKPDPEAEKAQNEAASKKWSSYLPTGKSFSSYVPNVQIPDSKEVVSAFQSSHYRDPNKSYAEQLYDFSKTPVGAGSIAVATGSGTASSIYAAYNAYTKLNPAKADQPPMEYLSLPHTRASSHSLVPQVGDTLLTNLRKPIMTLIEDTTEGAHDTLTAACDAYQYAALGVDAPEEHGSCAENLVLALKELNAKAGLKGTKAIGADITVNIAPTPLHLFMNAPVELDENAQSKSTGAKGAKLKIEEPQSKKRSFVRFKAERDIVIVMSACPMEIGKQNGGRAMACNYLVEEATEENMSSSKTSIKETAKPDNAIKRKPVNNTEKKAENKDEEESTLEDPSKRDSKIEQPDPPKPNTTTEENSQSVPPAEDKDSQPQPNDTPKPKKKPKKLERRSANTNGTATPTTS